MDASEYSKYVALDAEITATIGPDKQTRTEPTQVAITDINGNVLFNEYFFLTNKPQMAMGKRRADKLKKYAKRTYEAARNEVIALLHGKIVIGHDLIHDFTALRIDPVKDGLAGVLDSAKLPFFKRIDPSSYPTRSLKNLAGEFLHRNIQKGTMHDASEDAKASANLIRTTFPYLNAPMPITRETVAALKVVADYARRMGIESEVVKPQLNPDAAEFIPMAAQRAEPNLLRFEPVKSAANYAKEMEGLEFNKSMAMYLSEMEGLNMRRTAKNYLREMEGLNMRKTAKNYLKEMEGLRMPTNYFANVVNDGNKVSRRKTRRLRRRT